MNKLKNILLIILVSHVSVTFVIAEETQVSFGEIADVAFSNSPALSRLKNKIMQQKAQAVLLGTLENPELLAETRPYFSDSKGNDVEYEIGVSQPVKLSYFSKRGTVSELMNSAVSVEEKIALNELHQNLLLLYGKVWAIQQKEQFVLKAEKRVKAMYSRVSDKQKGLFPESTIKLFEASTLKLSSQLFRIKADQARALAAITNLSSQKYSGKKFKSLTLNSLSGIKNIEYKETGIPVIDRIKLRSKIADAQLELAKLDSYPKFAPKISFEHVDNGTDRINLGITMDLPFFNRNQSARISAEAEKNEASAIRQYLESGALNEELNLLLQAAQASEKQSTLYRDKIIPVLNSSLGAAEHEFNAGQGNPFQIWQTISELMEAQDLYLELWIKALSERVELSVLYGKDF